MPYLMQEISTSSCQEQLQKLLPVCGFPGSAHDARVLQNGDLYDEPERGAILQEPCVTIGGTDIRPYLVAYPQAPWLIKPFPEGTRDHEEITFDKELSRARVTVKRVFSILKSRSRVLQKRLDTVEPRYNEPQYNDIPSITINMLCPGERYSKMYGTEAQYNNLRYNDIPNIMI